MNSENPIAQKRRFKNGVFAALDLCAEKRATESGINPSASGSTGQRHVVERAAAIIDAEADKIEANDFSAIASALASQALALDVIFEEFARKSAELDLFDAPMHMALRAQSQCRVTFKNLVALKNPQRSQNSSNRTVESVKIPT